MTASVLEFMDDGKTPRCQVRVYHPMGNWGHTEQCRRAGRTNDGGVWHCKQHSDAEVQRRGAAKDAKMDKEWAGRRMQIYGHSFYNVLEQIAAGHNDARGLARKTIHEFNGGK